jgi:predicted NAD/FAD-binding protein
MNILQHIESPKTFCVSLNSSDQIDPDKVLKRFLYHHPVFNRQSIAAQARRSEINGVANAWFCGAYWYNGFHEDGVRSALDVVRGIETLSHNLSDKGAA